MSWRRLPKCSEVAKKKLNSDDHRCEGIETAKLPAKSSN